MGACLVSYYGVKYNGVPDMKVLIVENSPSLRERMERIFSGLRGVRVVGCAATAAEAAEKIRETEPDVITLDIRLDEGTGYDVLEEVKLLIQRPKVIVFTNYPDPRYRAKYLQAGADYFFDKSTELDSVLGVLNTLRGEKSSPDASDSAPAELDGHSEDG
jgi:DNA-binding NarL/FixJ family response regulator